MTLRAQTIRIATDLQEWRDADPLIIREGDGNISTPSARMHSMLYGLDDNRLFVWLTDNRSVAHATDARRQVANLKELAFKAQHERDYGVDIEAGEAAEFDLMNSVDQFIAELRCWAGHMPADPVAAAPASTPTAAKTMKIMKVTKWKEARKQAEDHCVRNAYPGITALAAIVGCWKAMMSKAVDRSPKLRAMHVEYEARRKGGYDQAMTEAVATSARQPRKADPIDDDTSASTEDIFSRLLQQAKPSERATLNAMTPDQRRSLVALSENDPDAHSLYQTPCIRRGSK